MPAYRSVLTGLHALIAALFGLIVTERERFLNADPLLGGYAYLVVLLGLFFLFRYAHILSTLLLEKIPGVSPALRRLLAGTASVEGNWPLAVVAYDRQTQRASLTYLGLLNITYRDGQLKVTGRDWYPNGHFAHDFESQQSRLDGSRLQYWYHQGEDSRMRGYTEIHFFPADARRERLAGEFLDKEHNAARFCARRLPSNVKPRTDRERFEAALAFWNDIRHDIDSIAARPVSSDWS